MTTSATPLADAQALVHRVRRGAQPECPADGAHPRSRPEVGVVAKEVLTGSAYGQ